MSPPIDPAASGFRPRVTSWMNDDAWRSYEEQAFFVLTILIGAAVGLVVVAFILVTEHLGARLLAPDAAGWHRLATPALGALVSGILLYRFFPAARGSGIPQTKAALLLNDGLIQLRTVFGKFACSSLSLASGIALGREGPAVHVGAGIASVLGQRLGLGPSQTKRLVPVGAAAAVAAAFNTPIAAVLFTLEEVVDDLHAPVLGSIVLSSATAWMVLHLLLGDEPLFHVPAYQLVHPAEFLVYAALGVAGGIVSVAFVKLLLVQRGWFQRLPASTVWFQPAVGGLAIGVMGWVVPSVLGVGYNHVGEALNGKMALGMMALLLGLKLVATATGYASGNAGGIFGPSLFLGAMMGGSVGSVVHTWFPDYTGGAGAYALVGMGAAFAGIIRVPFTSVVMIFEITRDYTIIVPLMIANLVAYFVSSRLQPEPIYEALLHQDGIRLPSRRQALDDSLPVGLAMQPARVLVPAGETVDAAATRLGVRAEGPSREGESGGIDPERCGWPIMDGDAWVGWLGVADLRQALRDGRGGSPVADVVPDARQADAAVPPRRLHQDESLDQALKRMAAAGFDVLPVVGRTEPARLLGVVSVPDVIRAYRRQLPEPDAGSRSPRAVILRLAAIVLAVLAVSGLAAYRFRAVQLENAARSLEAGRALVQQHRDADAIEPFRRALAITGSNDARLALAEALLAADRAGEAALYFGEVLRTDPASGEASLGLARIAAQQGRVDDAILAYGRAVVGRWLDQPQQHRVSARFEFADYLARTGMRDQALAQLLELERQVAGDPAQQLGVGSRLLGLGAEAQAVSLFHELLRSDPSRIEGQIGLAKAELARNNYAAARDAFLRAQRLDPRSMEAAAGRALCDEIIAMDPDARRLPSAERHRRTLLLLAAALQQFDACAKAAAPADLPQSAHLLAAAARRALATGSRPASLTDAAADNLEIAGQLWLAQQRQCPTSGSPSAADVLLRRLSG
jgi:chloride channel protein, CIC family